jgi:hypothetical protein
MRPNPSVSQRVIWLLGGLFRSYLMALLLLTTIAVLWESQVDNEGWEDTYKAALLGLFFGVFNLGVIFVLSAIPLMLWIILIPQRWLVWEFQTVAAVIAGGVIPAIFAAGWSNPSSPEQFTLMLFLALLGAVTLTLTLLHVSARAAHLRRSPAKPDASTTGRS